MSEIDKDFDPMYEPGTESVVRPATESVAEPASEPAAEPVAEPAIDLDSDEDLEGLTDALADLAAAPVAEASVVPEAEATAEPVFEAAEEAEAAADDVPPTPPPKPRSAAVHWLVRIAERAGLGETERPEVSPSVRAQEAWSEIAKAYSLSDSALCVLVAEYFRLEVAQMDMADPNAALLIPETMARKHHIFPVLEDDRHFVVATCDPTDVEAERALGFSTGRTPLFQVASPGAIQDTLDARFSPEKAVDALLGGLADDVSEDAVRLVEEMGPDSVSEDDIKATPVVKLTNLIIRDGINEGASDIHIEPGRKLGAVRYRVDGVLRKHMDLPMQALNRIISRIKVLSRLDIADRLRPQDGKARVRVKSRGYDLRVSTIPAGGAEKCVIRILDSSSALTLDDLELPAFELARLRQLLQHRDGVVVVTGPTGSGKTTTLYGALRELADGKVNIMTVEDPIEYELAGITQTQVETKQGMTFSGALRAMLRQDPDVILVGEIRDKETAVTAAQAAMTGHLGIVT